MSIPWGMVRKDKDPKWFTMMIALHTIIMVGSTVWMVLETT